MTAPPHAKEHHDLMQVVGKVVGTSPLIDGVIIITIGHDGRPMCGGNVENPAVLMEMLRQVIDMEDHIGGVSEVKMPKDN